MRALPTTATACVALVLLAGCSAGPPAPPDLADLHGLAVDPDDSDRLFVATHSGLYVLEGGSRWSQRSQESFDVMGFTVHPRNGSVMYASGHPGLKGVLKSTDAGRTWTAIALVGQVDFHAFATSLADPTRLWGFYGDRVGYSADAGVNWAFWTPRGTTSIHSFATHALNVNRIYASTPDGVFRSDDGGHNWGQVYEVRDSPPLSAVATGQSESELVYAHFPGAGLKRSRDAGATWESVVTPLASQDLIWAIAIDPEDARVLYLGTNRAAIYRTGDAGATWTTLHAGQ